MVFVGKRPPGEHIFAVVSVPEVITGVGKMGPASFWGLAPGAAQESDLPLGEPGAKYAQNEIISHMFPEFPNSDPI